MTEADEKSGSEHKLDRTLAISDGVFAFAITLLVLDLAVPQISGASSIDLWNGLTQEFTTFLSYALSFLIAGLWWNAHHRIYTHIRRSNPTLRWLNLSFLAWITLLPFFTKILDSYHTLPLGVILYALDQTAAGTFLTLTWFYASKNHRLIDSHMSQRAIRYSTIRCMTPPLFFLASIGIAMVNPVVATYFWLVMFPVQIITTHIEKKPNVTTSK
jgi:uncharacterized membrane protein